MTMTGSDLASSAAEFLRTRWQRRGVGVQPRIGVILGSGLRRAADDEVSAGGLATCYSEIPGMPITRVPGHEGRLVAGTAAREDVLLLQGRAHFYEGWSLSQMTFSVRLLAELGVRTLVVTNAAGGIRSDLCPGSLMLIDDHISRVPLHDLFDSSATEYHRSQCTPSIWDDSLLTLASQLQSPLEIQRGCYAMMPGPSYETPAEVRMLSRMGADAVGMSTIPEAVVAAQRKLRVLGISCITNAAAGLSHGPLNHEEVSEAASRVETDFVAWLWRLLAAIPCGI